MSYPECEKLEAAREKWQSIEEFLRWLKEEKGAYLARDETWVDQEPTAASILLAEGDPRYQTVEVERTKTFPFSYTENRLLSEFFGIDQAKLEKERRAILATLS